MKQKLIKKGFKLSILATAVISVLSSTVLHAQENDIVAQGDEKDVEPVSYTHLTLPTICSV